MDRLAVPCEYCGFAIGLTGEGRPWHCPCGAAYCGTLCQHRHWHQHKVGCRWRFLRDILRQWGVPREVAEQVLAFIKIRHLGA